MILALALRNILGKGWKSLINVLILAIVLIGMIFMQSMYFSWMQVAERQQRDWEYGQGMLRVTSYDPYDPFTWENSLAPIPMSMKQAFAAKQAVAVLLSPGAIYPQGRMMPAVAKGIDSQQQMLKFPVKYLKQHSDSGIPAVIGTSMARSSRLQEGDILPLRIKDINGSFNAVDIYIAKVISIPVATMDTGTIWLDLHTLQEIKDAPNMATYIALNSASLADSAPPGYHYISPDKYFADLYQIRETERFGEVMIYGMLIFLAMLAIFDSQALAVFTRRREIGTLAALGMTKAKIALLFTTEGVLNLLFAAMLTPILGFPLFWYFAVYGYKLPEGYDDFGMIGFSEPVYLSYPLPIILGTLLFLLVITALVSWLPTRRITRMNPTDALRGKVN